MLREFMLRERMYRRRAVDIISIYQIPFFNGKEEFIIERFEMNDIFISMTFEMVYRRTKRRDLKVYFGNWKNNTYNTLYLVKYQV